jgi:hypothetical protein
MRAAGLRRIKKPNIVKFKAGKIRNDLKKQHSFSGLLAQVLKLS